MWDLWWAKWHWGASETPDGFHNEDSARIRRRLAVDRGRWKEFVEAP
jgi:hypothetical protein